MRRAMTLVELLTVFFILSALVGLLLPSVQMARESARRAQCQNQLRQIGLALHQFESANRVFPPSGWTKVSRLNPLGKNVGWRTILLPYLEQENLVRLYQPSKEWWEGENLQVGSRRVSIYVCPSTPPAAPSSTVMAKPPRPMLTGITPLAPTDYEAIQGVQPASIDRHFYNDSNRYSVLHRNGSTRFSDIADGTTQTLMVVECSGRPDVYRDRVRWPSLTNDQGQGWIDNEGAFSLDGSSSDGSREGCGIANGCLFGINKRNDNEPYSFHPQGTMGLFADGRVSWIGESIDIRVLASLSTKNAGETNDLGSGD